MGGVLNKVQVYLGSLTDTNAALIGRKTFALEAEKKLKHIWKNDTPTGIKIMIVSGCVSSVFLYNSKLKAILKDQE